MNEETLVKVRGHIDSDKVKVLGIEYNGYAVAIINNGVTSLPIEIARLYAQGKVTDKTWLDVNAYLEFEDTQEKITEEIAQDNQVIESESKPRSRKKQQS